MDRTSFHLRIPQNIKQAIGDRASVENRTQTDLILEAVQQYLSTPLIFRNSVGGNEMQVNYLPCWKFEQLPDAIGLQYTRKHKRLKQCQESASQLKLIN